ncbi:MAG: CpsD/CapB family tyrosine-protein kinase [Clostridia bacterium]|nr:CpsD/CapB family tyrosine-protein kinase [Clostridia bacterium]
MGLFQKKSKQQQFASGGSENKKTLHKNLNFTAIEQYKLIRANLDFTLPEDEKCPVIGVTSSIRGEGKSTTAVNLAYVFAEKGSNVLLIDADLRIPSIAKKLEIESSPGLTDLLRGKGAQTTEFKSYLLPNWFILPAGEVPPNPSELLGSNRMKSILGKLREMFDCIIIDLPPVNIVSDVIAVSGMVSGMIVVVREEYTEKKELERCFRQLELSNVNILGCVLNEAKPEGGSYGKYRKYKYYKYYKYYQNYQSSPKGTEK